MLVSYRLNRDIMVGGSLIVSTGALLSVWRHRRRAFLFRDLLIGKRV